MSIHMSVQGTTHMSCTNAYPHMCLYMCIPADVHAKLIWARFRCRATSPVVKQLCACMCSRICAPMREWFRACVRAPCVCSPCVHSPCARPRVQQRDYSCLACQNKKACARVPCVCLVHAHDARARVCVCVCCTRMCACLRVYCHVYILPQ